MSSPVFRMGQGVRFKVELSIDGVDSDPTTVTLTLTAPDGTASSIPASKTATGQYQSTAVVKLDQTGRWHWDWDADGALIASDSGDLWVVA